MAEASIYDTYQEGATDPLIVNPRQLINEPEISLQQKKCRFEQDRKIRKFLALGTRHAGNGI